MMEESFDVPTHNGEVKPEDMASLFEQLGAPRAASLFTRLTELREEVKGAHSVEESMPALVDYVGNALFEVVTTISALEIAAKADSQPRDVTVNLIEE